MGCSASRPISILTKNPEQRSSNPSVPASESSISSSSPVRRAFSLQTPLVHHPPLRKGDTHHLVSLTSTTYGSLLIDRTTMPNTPILNRNDNDPPPPRRHTKNTPFKAQTDPEEISSSLSPDSVINTWELMEGLDDNDFDFNSSAGGYHHSRIGFQTRPISCRYTNFDGLAKKRVNSFESARYMESNLEEYASSSSASTTSYSSLRTKPLWQHLSEESLLSKMDPNVGLTYRRALSSRQLGYEHSKTRSLGSSPFSSNSFSNTLFRLPGTEDKIVIYFTSLRGIRKTYEDCCSVRMIFRGFRVPVDERDISMDSEFKKELQKALGGKAVTLPQVFIRGKYVGGSDEVKQLHEVGELSTLLDGFPILDPGFVCNGCGDARFLPCLSCNGSRKVFEEDEGELRRCSDCNENGLIRCPGCCS